MRIPDSLAPLFDYGIVEEVVRPLMSGKEAQIYVVVSGGKQCVAKVYKEAQNRTFKHRAEYTEGRKVRNSRDQRAIQKRSKHGRAQDEAAWRSTEVDMIHRLHAAGVRVPVPMHFIDGVLIMELITDADGNPAPRLADLVFDPAGAQAMYERLIREVIRMLCAGVVHGDLSDFNVLVGADGPVLIDFPQSVDTAHNANARKLLLRDVENMHRFLGQFVPNARRLPYAEEMWDLFQQNAITPETRLTGRYRPSERRADTHAVLEAIQDANYDERKRRESLGLRGGPPAGEASRQTPRQGPTRTQGGAGGHSNPRPPAHAGQGRPQHRPAPPPQDAARSAPSQGNAPARRGPPQNGPTRSDQTHHEPARHGPPRNQPPRNGPPRHGPPPGRPPPHGPSHSGAQHPDGGRRPPPHPPGARSPRSGPEARRDEGRRIEVIVRRPLPR
jgi:RIO kinase 1